MAGVCHEVAAFLINSGMQGARHGAGEVVRRGAGEVLAATTKDAVASAAKQTWKSWAWAQCGVPSATTVVKTVVKVGAASVGGPLAASGVDVVFAVGDGLTGNLPGAVAGIIFIPLNFVTFGAAGSAKDAAVAAGKDASKRSVKETSFILAKRITKERGQETATKFAGK